MVTIENGNDEPEFIMASQRFQNPKGALNYRTAAGIAVVVVLVTAFGFLFFNRPRENRPDTVLAAAATPVSPGSVNLLLGNPSNARTNISDRDNYLMVKPFYALSYNDSHGEPNWVSWRVTRADLGDAPRKQLFDPDGTLPEGFTRITHKDYTGSGFDRGHMCPHSDRAANVEMSYATFVMTNIIPQAPNLNQKAWAQLENYSREQAMRGDHLYIVSGPLGMGGRGSRGVAEHIGGGKVLVPSECWKIIVVVTPAGGDDDLAKIDASTRVIAVIMPNDQEKVGDPWAQFRVSPAEIERRTGYHFFDRLNPEIAAALRQKTDDREIPAPKPLIHPEH